jgi:SH3-like domain-containing protein
MMRFIQILSIVCFVLLLGSAGAAHAETKTPNLPRFASLAKDEIYVRTGPALQYPIRWVYKRRGLPVEIIREYDTWRQIRDFDGSIGWVHHGSLAGYRTAIIKNEAGVSLMAKPDSGAADVVRLEQGVVVALDECNPDWCRVRISGFKGWTQRPNLWGIYASEEIR